MARRCRHLTASGTACRAAPLLDGAYCRFHDPDSADEVAEARRLGGQRRRRERVLAGAYDFTGLLTVEQLQRVLEVVALDSFALENSVARNRTLVHLVHVAARVLEVGELADRIESLEQLLKGSGGVGRRR